MVQAISKGTIGNIVMFPYSKAEFGDTGNIIGGVEITIVSHKVSSGKKYYLTGIVGTGGADARFILYADDKKIDEGRISPAERMFVRFYNSPIVFDENVVVRLKVEHQEAVSRRFQGALIGFEG